nr:MAG TPA: hypothetical protein [Caudoviricetes sp.]
MTLIGPCRPLSPATTYSRRHSAMPTHCCSR